ncbi:MAG: glycoside hydrolase family 3 N-terminal domain-containing protein [Candidatus Methylacidiphilales bacterium]|nr:glycoside hydrolase family 3 N-terminal domain-containing protein [Candidatus Methylacidiphilales bacterium]
MATFDTERVARIGKQTAAESKAANFRCSWSPVLDVARDARWGRIEKTYRKITVPGEPYRCRVDQSLPG